MQENANVFKGCTLSTAHITQGTADLLWKNDRNQNDGLPIFFPKIIRKEGYGWIFAVPGDDDEFGGACPEDLRACLQYAAELGCEMMVMDPEGSLVGELPTYNW